ncbi:unnamed protein product [Citrullus colocynthis]|uniref:Uncharacterized protein n=1 Tax=Citrullus colocynthis TaxID=252529 RepID=A0ABP0Y4Q1_9ROSI
MLERKRALTIINVSRDLSLSVKFAYSSILACVSNSNSIKVFLAVAQALDLANEFCRRWNSRRPISSLNARLPTPLDQVGSVGRAFLI